jgi:hypothetical protein
MAPILPKSHGFIQAMRVLQAVVAPALIGSAACGRGPLYVGEGLCFHPHIGSRTPWPRILKPSLIEPEFPRAAE